MQHDEPDNSDRPVTKSEVKELLAATKGEMEQLLAEQAHVILEAVDVKLDKKFGEVMKGIHAVMNEVQAHREEDVAGAAQLRRHHDKLENHESRIKTLELQPQQSA